MMSLHLLSFGKIHLLLRRMGGKWVLSLKLQQKKRVLAKVLAPSSWVIHEYQGAGALSCPDP